MSWKKLENKDLLATLKKKSYPKICGILKLWKLKDLSKIDAKFLELWKYFPTYKWGIIYMMH
jgi:hypothetical protein